MQLYVFQKNEGNSNISVTNKESFRIPIQLKLHQYTFQFRIKMAKKKSSFFWKKTCFFFFCLVEFFYKFQKPMTHLPFKVCISRCFKRSIEFILYKTKSFSVPLIIRFKMSAFLGIFKESSNTILYWKIFI